MTAFSKRFYHLFSMCMYSECQSISFPVLNVIKLAYFNLHWSCIVGLHRRVYVTVGAYIYIYNIYTYYIYIYIQCIYIYIYIYILYIYIYIYIYIWLLTSFHRHHLKENYTHVCTQYIAQFQYIYKVSCVMNFGGYPIIARNIYHKCTIFITTPSQIIKYELFCKTW